MNKKAIFLGLFSTLALLAAPAGHAASSGITGKVARVLITPDAKFGGCAVLLSVSPHTRLATCGVNWVSFGCSGEAVDTVRAYRMLDQAQLALATGKNVYVGFTDETKYNGYCSATRIDVY